MMGASGQKERLTVLQVVPELEQGGVEVGTIDLARMLVARGHRALVASRGGRLVAELEAAGAEHVVLAVHRKAYPLHPGVARRLGELVRREGVDVVHARSRAPAWYAWRALRQTPQAAFVTTAHGFYQNRWYSQVMGRGEAVIAVSRGLARYLAKGLGFDPKRITVIYRGLDLERYRPERAEECRAALCRELDLPADAFIVAQVGRISRRKGHRYFFEALAGLKRGGAPVAGLVVGEVHLTKDEYGRELNKLVETLGLKETVKFMGYRADVPEIVTGADCLVFPSTEPESFGRAAVEAMASGKPVVATRLGGLREIVRHRETGFLVEPSNSRALAAALGVLMDNREAGIEMGRKGRERVKARFTNEVMFNRTLAVYRRVLERRLGGGGVKE